MVFLLSEGQKKLLWRSGFLAPAAIQTRVEAVYADTPVLWTNRKVKQLAGGFKSDITGARLAKLVINMRERFHETIKPSVNRSVSLLPSYTASSPGFCLIMSRTILV